MIVAPQPAAADTVPRSEAGEVLLRTSGIEIADGPVRRGEVFATVTGRPAMVALISTDVNTRARPGPTPGPRAGSYLFGYQLDSGVAFCEPLAASGTQQRRQCFRDFNADGVFDGGYVTSRGGAARYFVERVETLVPIAPLPFTFAAPTDLPEVTFQLRLVRVALDEAAIAVVTETDNWAVEGAAVEGEAGVYAFSFGRFRITWVEGDAYRIERLSGNEGPGDAITAPAVDSNADDSAIEAVADGET
jgi:hypothetical protein